MKTRLITAIVGRIDHEAALAALLALLVFGPTLAAGQATTAPRSPLQESVDLVSALNATPGCLGVETARTASGKQVVFAWFENKQAVLNWYYSEAHQSLIKQFFPGAPPRTPMADVPDDGGPVLAVAALTMADKPVTGVTSLPVSQISIELYTPLPGGLALGGRFAPADVKVPGVSVAPMSAPGGNR